MNREFDILFYKDKVLVFTNIYRIYDHMLFLSFFYSLTLSLTKTHCENEYKIIF